MKYQLEQELERALQGVDDVKRIVTLRILVAANGVSIVKKADGLRHIAPDGSLPALAIHRSARTVVVIPWDRFIAFMTRYWAEVSTRDKREPGTRSEPHLRARKWQHTAAGLKRQLGRISAERDALKLLVDRKPDGEAKARSLETQQMLLEYRELRTACLALLRAHSDTQPGAFTARSNAVRKIYEVMRGE